MISKTVIALLHASVLASAFLIANPAFSAEKKKSKINTQLFEQEAEATSVSGKVKVVREIQEETEVFIDNPKGSSGPFTLPANIKNRAKMMKLLNASQKPGGPAVVINVDAQQRITNVESSGDEQTTKDL